MNTRLLVASMAIFDPRGNGGALPGSHGFGFRFTDLSSSLDFIGNNHGTIVPMTTHSALDQLMSPTAGWLTPQAARQLVDWQISEELRSRIEELGCKANRGTLTPDEDAEYRAYLDDAEVISLMQAKARRLYFRMND